VILTVKVHVVCKKGTQS